MSKDWTGNSKSIYTTLGANNHIKEDRAENDYYATDPKAAELLCEIESFSHDIWEPACGEGHLSEVLKRHGYHVSSSDLIDRGYGTGGIDFLTYGDESYSLPVDIITNPPYKYASEFVKHALDIVADGQKVAMFLKLQFLEGKSRKELFAKYPPKYVYVSSERIMCARNGDFDALKKSGGSAVAYAWYIWEKGYTGATTLRWFN